MKITLATTLSLLSLSNAWVIPQKQPAYSATALQAHKKSVIVGAITGWALATQMATAAPVSLDTPIFTEQTPTTVIAAGAYQPEDSFASTDLSMPSYNVENTAELLGIPKAPAGPSEKDLAREAKKQAKAEEKAAKRAAADPEKEAKRAAKEAAKAEKKAAQDAEKALKSKSKAEKGIQKKLAAKEKMAAKKAERASFQQVRQADEE